MIDKRKLRIGNEACYETKTINDALPFLHAQGSVRVITCSERGKGKENMGPKGMVNKTYRKSKVVEPVILNLTC